VKVYDRSSPADKKKGKNDGHEDPPEVLSLPKGRDPQGTTMSKRVGAPGPGSVIESNSGSSKKGQHGGRLRGRSAEKLHVGRGQGNHAQTHALGEVVKSVEPPSN